MPHRGGIRGRVLRAEASLATPPKRTSGLCPGVRL